MSSASFVFSSLGSSQLSPNEYLVKVNFVFSGSRHKLELLTKVSLSFIFLYRFIDLK